MTPSPPLADRLVDGDELGSVRKCCLDVDLADHLGNSLHDLLAPDNSSAVPHQLGHALAIASAFQHVICDQRHHFRVVELYPALRSTLSDHRRDRYQKLIPLAWGQVHSSLYTLSAYKH